MCHHSPVDFSSCASLLDRHVTPDLLGLELILKSRDWRLCSDHIQCTYSKVNAHTASPSARLFGALESTTAQNLGTGVREAPEVALSAMIEALLYAASRRSLRLHLLLTLSSPRDSRFEGPSRLDSVYTGYELNLYFKLRLPSPAHVA